MTVFGYPPPNPYHDIKEHTMTTPRFRKYTDNAGEFRWSLLGANGEIVATSEGYTRADDRDRSITTMRRIIDEIAVDVAVAAASALVLGPGIADHQAARQEFTRRATDRNPDGPDAA